jgi:serine/threonine protein kinase
MAPEQTKGRDADKRSDIWAFVCVFYEMLTGRRTFDGEDMTDVLGAVVRLEPTWVAFPADVPPAVRTLIQRCSLRQPGPSPLRQKGSRRPSRRTGRRSDAVHARIERTPPRAGAMRHVHAGCVSASLQA